MFRMPTLPIPSKCYQYTDTLIKQAKMEDFAWFLEDPDHAAAVQDFDFI